MDNRFNKLLLYLEKHKISSKNLVAIKSDASFRKYYRLENNCLLYTSPSPRDMTGSRMPSSA